MGGGGVIDLTLDIDVSVQRLLEGIVGRHYIYCGFVRLVSWRRDLCDIN